MKLRNKKTGEIVPIDQIDITIRNKDGIPEEFKKLKSLAELNEEWEDYEPAEPLIKDEKIRKAVRAWAKANEVEFLDVESDSMIKDCGSNHIEFLCSPFRGITKQVYYITELCGEEEECER